MLPDSLRKQSVRLKEFLKAKKKFDYFRYGLRGRELVNNVGKVMLQGGGTFGTFMAIGTGLRC